MRGTCSVLSSAMGLMMSIYGCTNLWHCLGLVVRSLRCFCRMIVLWLRIMTLLVLWIVDS